MASFPTTLDSPAGTGAFGTTLLAVLDHAQDHRVLGSAVIGIETNLGTNAGTNMFKGYLAGNFPYRVDSSGVPQQALTQGTIFNEFQTLSTAAAFGLLSGSGDTNQYATMNFQQRGTNKTWFASHRQGSANEFWIGYTADGTTFNNTVRIKPLAPDDSMVIGTQGISIGTVTKKAIGSQAYPGTVNTTHTLQCGSATRHLVTMPNSAGSLTLAVAGVIPNQPFIIEVLQGTAGNGTVNWFSTVTWLNSGTAAPTQGTTPSRKATYGFIATGTATFDGYVVGKGE